MAVLASAEVTLSAVVDVQAVWRFYLLQSSNLTAPTKPTTYPPPSAWNDTEPTYDPTKTQTLYVVDCNVFSDGTFDYTNVSISTAYEAAKMAYNKAQNAQNSASNNAEAIEVLERNVYSEIASTESGILSTVSEGYYKKTDGEALGQQVSGLQTEVEQTTTAFTVRFTTIEEDVADIEKYVRIENGNIILGESTNELTLRMENDKITFLDGYQEVAYFSNHKLYVTDGDFLNALRIGNFVFAPRQNGNLSFTKL